MTKHTLKNLPTKKPFSTGIPDLDKTLDGGLFPGSLTLFVGRPGSGKTTLLLQAANKIASEKTPVLFVSGEQSLADLGQLAARLNVRNPHVHIVASDNVTTSEIVQKLEAQKYSLLILDSIASICSSAIAGPAGSPSQRKELAYFANHYAKRHNAATILVGHFNADGTIAGPEVIEHLSDTVLVLQYSDNEGDGLDIRCLTTDKHRYGQANIKSLIRLTHGGFGRITYVPSTRIQFTTAIKSIADKKGN